MFQRIRSFITRPKAQAGAHHGASTTDRETASWLPSFGSADADLLDDLPMLRARNRDLAINNGIASGAIQTITDNVVGTGFRLSAKPDYRALGRDAVWANEWSNQVEALWRMADMKAETKRIKRGVSAGVKQAGAGLKGDLRKQVVAAGLGARLARTWRDRTYPNKGYNAAAMVWSKAPQIIRIFDEGAVIRSKSGLWLAIPTQQAPKRGVGGKRINPSNFPEHRFGS